MIRTVGTLRFTSCARFYSAHPLPILFGEDHKTRDKIASSLINLLLGKAPKPSEGLGALCLSPFSTSKSVRTTEGAPMTPQAKLCSFRLARTVRGAHDAVSGRSMPNLPLDRRNRSGRREAGPKIEANSGLESVNPRVNAGDPYRAYPGAKSLRRDCKLSGEQSPREARTRLALERWAAPPQPAIDWLLD